MDWRIVDVETAQALWECGVKLKYDNSKWEEGHEWLRFNNRLRSPKAYADYYRQWQVQFKAQVEGK